MSQIGKVREFDRVDAPEDHAADSLRVLAVGPAPAGRERDGVRTLPGTRFVDFDELTPELLELHQPDVVLSPLVTQGFDCVELAHRLVNGGFGGRYRAFAGDLPRPDLVTREIRTSFPGLDFDLLVVAAGQETRSA